MNFKASNDKENKLFHNKNVFKLSQIWSLMHIMFNKITKYLCRVIPSKDCCNENSHLSLHDSFPNTYDKN